MSSFCISNETLDAALLHCWWFSYCWII